MSSIALALAITTVVCLFFSNTRLFGVIGLFLLIALFPVASSIALVTAGIFYFYWRKRHVR
jgi:hypothetical protein